MDPRLWMYNMHYETGAILKSMFVYGVRNFIDQIMTLYILKNNGLVRYPCSAVMFLKLLTQIRLWFICTVMDLS